MIGAQQEPVQKEYGSLASKYDRKWAGYVEATIRETLRRIPLSPGDQILDVACGTGVLLRAVAASDVRVILAGVDATPEMLEVANSRIGSLADLRHGRAESLPFEEIKRLIEAHPNICFLTAGSDPISVEKSDNPFTRMFQGIWLEDRWKDLMIRHPDRLILAIDSVWDSFDQI